jgi:hypothetical protein
LASKGGKLEKGGKAMALDVFYRAELRAAIVASVVLALRVGLVCGMTSADFISGVLTHAEHDALAFGLDWPAMVVEVKETLGTGFDGGIAFLCPEHVIKEINDNG